MISTNLNESILLQASLGDHAAFRQLYKLYRLEAFKFAMNMLHNVEEAENIVHDLFAKIWDNRHKIRPQQNFQSFLFTCLRNMILDHLKREKRKQLAFRDYLIEKSKKEDSTAHKERRCRMVQAAMNKLSDKRRAIIYMCFVDGKSYQEIADSYSISKNTVRNQLVKAKQLLRNHLEQKISKVQS